MDNNSKKNNIAARNDWKKAFKKDPKPDFDDLYNKRKKLNQSQINELLDFSINSREEKLEENRLYGNIWDQLKPNERLTIEDAFFNGQETLVGNKTNFRKEIHLYYGYDTLKEEKNNKEKGKIEHLENAMNELKERSNPYIKDQDGNFILDKNGKRQKSKGVQNRRDAQSGMGSSQNSPVFSKSGEQPLPKKPIDAKIADTIIPRGVKNPEWQNQKNIWDDYGAIVE